MHPGLSRPPACREGPGRVLAALAVRSSQAQVHVTNFDYNHRPLNTMPGTRRTSRARAAARISSAHGRGAGQAPRLEQASRTSPGGARCPSFSGPATKRDEQQFLNERWPS
jgi:hypothetical protein